MKEKLIQKMKALSNECRVDLLLILAKAGGPICVGNLAARSGLPRPGFPEHFRSSHTLGWLWQNARALAFFTI